MKLPYFAIRDHIQAGGLRGSNDLYNMLYVGFAWGEATFMAVGGPLRWQGEQYTFARQVPWYPYSWALALFLLATALAIGIIMDDKREPDELSLRGLLIVGGAIGIAGWCVFYAYCLWRSGQMYPTQVGATGPFQWGFFALWYMVKVGQHLELKYWARQ